MSSRIKMDDYDDDQQPRGLIPQLIALVKAPFSPFISRAALRAYLTTILAVSTAFTLFGLAIVAYSLFYWSYIPRIGFERTIHLQFDNVFAPHLSQSAKTHPYPYGSAILSPDLVADQGYDVWVELNMPRTADNQEAGNFMLDVSLCAERPKKATTTTPNIIQSLQRDVGSIWPTGSDAATILATSRRSAILPYRSWWVDLLYKATELHWYILGFRSEQDKLRVPVFERMVFVKPEKDVQGVFRLEIQSSHRLQIYSARASFRARFTGLRWLMYNHRIISAILFISTFWMTELVFAGVAWAAISLMLAKGNEIEQEIKEAEIQEAADRIKREDDNEEPVLSDTERTFPTLSGQPPLRYQSPTKEIKREENITGVIPDVPKGMLADVEDEDEDDEDVDFIDSGLGTSLESSGPARRESLRRRRGRQGVRTPGSSGSSTLHGEEAD